MIEELDFRISTDFVLRDIEVATREFHGHTISMSSQRYKVFKDNPNCVCCRRVGDYIKLTRSNPKGRYHLNLYSTDGVLMTKDHIIAKANGGTDTLGNYQTMCTHCNCFKGAT